MTTVQTVLFDLDYTLVDSSPTAPYRDAREWSEAYEKIPECTIYAGVREVLDELDETLAIGIVTNTPRSYAARVLNHFSLPFDHLTCWHDTDRHKPHPAPIEHAMEALEVGAEATIYIGDTPQDMQAIRRAGGRGVAALWGADSPDDVRDADPWAVAERPSEILSILDRELLEG